MKTEFNARMRLWFPVVIVIFISLLISNCKKWDSTPTGDLVIMAGYMCGWGSGEDSITISVEGIKYKSSVPAQPLQPKIEKSRSVSRSEWNEIKKEVNLEVFRKLTYNTCNICVDGCDEWINIRDDDYFHGIRFGKGTQIDPISTLQARLASIRAEFNSN